MSPGEGLPQWIQIQFINQHSDPQAWHHLEAPAPKIRSFCIAASKSWPRYMWGWLGILCLSGYIWEVCKGCVWQCQILGFKSKMGLTWRWESAGREGVKVKSSVWHSWSISIYPEWYCAISSLTGVQLSRNSQSDSKSDRKNVEGEANTSYTNAAEIMIGV